MAELLDASGSDLSEVDTKLQRLISEKQELGENLTILSTAFRKLRDEKGSSDPNVREMKAKGEEMQKRMSQVEDELEAAKHDLFAAAEAYAS